MCNVRKIVFYLPCLLLLAACNGGNASKTAIKDSDSVIKAEPKVDAKTSNAVDTVFKPYTLVDDYMVTDTAYCDFAIGDGVYAVVKKNNKLVDTIDKAYGFKLVDKGVYMYNVVDGVGPLGADIGEFVIIKNDSKISVSTLAPDFGWFANPEIIDHKIYYWLVKERKDQTYQIFAAEFDPVTKKTKSHYLFDDSIETDASGYFPVAYLDKGNIVFNGNKEFRFTPDFKLIP